MNDTPRTDAEVFSTKDSDYNNGPFVDPDFARKLERECEALRVEYESRAEWIAKMNSILGYDNSDGFHSEPDPFTIAQRIKSENSELRALHRPRCDVAPS